MNGDNWFFPNRTALTGWMSAAGFEVGLMTGKQAPNGCQYINALGRRVSGSVSMEHQLIGEQGGYVSDI